MQLALIFIICISHNLGIIQGQEENLWNDTASYNVPPFFYEFGFGQGDNVVRQNDDGSTGLFDISVRFPFFNRFRERIAVSMYCCY